MWQGWSEPEVAAKVPKREPARNDSGDPSWVVRARRCRLLPGNGSTTGGLPLDYPQTLRHYRRR